MGGKLNFGWISGVVMLYQKPLSMLFLPLSNQRSHGGQICGSKKQGVGLVTGEIEMKNPVV